MINRLRRKLEDSIFILCVGGVLYNILEILWRGYTHWSMFIVGGVCFNVIGIIHTVCRRCVIVRCALCSLAVTLIELFSGYFLNLHLKLNVWDYSGFPFNIKGQVCLLYSVLWGFLSIAAVPVYKFCIMRVNNELPRGKPRGIQRIPVHFHCGTATDASRRGIEPGSS